jgi:hypothetical protein
LFFGFGPIDLRVVQSFHLQTFRECGYLAEINGNPQLAARFTPVARASICNAGIFP